jgi:type I restriction enzyme S subunit
MTDESFAWSKTTLGDACEVNPPRPKLAGLPDSTPVLFVPMAAVDDVTGAVVLREMRTLGELRAGSYRTFAPGDIIFAKITPCMENGKCAIVPPVDTGICFGSTEFHVLRPRDGVDARFIYQIVRQETFRRVAKAHMTGSVGQARVPADFMRSADILLPQDEAVQVGMASLLDAVAAAGRSNADHLSRAQETLERFRRSVWAAACAGRFSEAWRAAHPECERAEAALVRHEAQAASVRTNLRRLKPSPGLRSVDVEVTLPETWTLKRVRELVGYKAIVDVQDGNHGELYPRKTDFVEGGLPGIPYISAENVTDEVLLDRAPRLAREVAARLRIGFAREGDVILTHNATVGRVAVLPIGSPDVVLSTSTTYYRTDARILLPEYLAIYMRSHFFQDQLTGIMEQTTRNQVPVTKQVELQIAVPPVDEQIAIVDRTGTMLRAADQVDLRLASARCLGERAVLGLGAKALKGETAMAQPFSSSRLA